MTILVLLAASYWTALYKSTGDQIKLVYDDEIDSQDPAKFVLYRRTGLNGKALKLAEGQSNVFNITMPGGTVQEYRFFVVPVTINSSGAVVESGTASNEVLILRQTVRRRK